MHYLRFISLCGIMMIAGYCLFAQTQQKVTIQDATVFLKGAELANTAKVNLPQGESEILFTNIAGNVNQQSITVGISNGNAFVESATFQNDYIGPKVFTPRVKILKDSVNAITDYREQLNNKLTVVEQQLSLIDENKKNCG